MPREKPPVKVFPVKGFKIYVSFRHPSLDFFNNSYKKISSSDDCLRPCQGRARSQCLQSLQVDTFFVRYYFYTLFAGTYLCEVTVTPTFFALAKTANMTVIGKLLQLLIGT